MDARSELSAELVEILEQIVADQLGPDTLDQALVVLMCTDAVAFARTYPTRVGLRARMASALLLELARPGMDAELRHELSVACELVAIGAAVRALH